MTKSGWCIANQHRKCPVTLPKRTCDCDCPDHGVDKDTDPTELSPLIKSIIEKYGIMK